MTGIDVVVCSSYQLHPRLVKRHEVGTAVLERVAPCDGHGQALGAPVVLFTQLPPFYVELGALVEMRLR